MTLGKNKDNLEGLELADAADVIADVVSRFETYSKASNPIEQATSFVALQESINTLAAWHPDYDSETKEIFFE